MAKWSPDLENAINKLGNYVETQMQDMTDPSSSATISFMRLMFRGVTTGRPLLAEVYEKSGIQETSKLNKNMWTPSLEMIVKLSEDNGSNAADKIKKALPVVEQITKAYKTDKKINNSATPTDAIRRIAIAKKLNIRYK